jgi:hypothetical protein
MIATINELHDLLQGTFLELKDIVEMSVLDTSETVFAIDVKNSNSFEAWSLLRSLTDQTGRWPVLTALWGDPSKSFDAQLRDADLFSRFYFKDECRDNRRDDTQDAIIEASKGIDVAQYFASLPLDDSLSIEDALEIALEGTQGEFGKIPLIEDRLAFLRNESLSTHDDIERWFFGWEIKHCANPLSLPEYGLTHMEWFEPESEALLLMPSLRGWETPAYINWFAAGGGRCNSQFIVALLEEWHSKYGAELVAHHGTMLHFVVARRPSTPDEAFHLAWQQGTVAPCTTILPGVSLRDHARALLHTDKWFLHERP